MSIKISQLPSASVLNDANILPIVGDILGTLTNQKITIGLLKTHVLATATISATSVGLGNVTNESKATMFANPTFTGTVSGVTAAMVDLGNVTNESKATMFANPTFTGTTTLNTALAGLLKATAGVVSVATAGTDYQSAQSVTGIVKSSGTTRSAATSGTDYAPGTSALTTGIVKSTTTTGALSIAVSGTDYQAPIGTISGLVKGNGANALIAAVAGTDYQSAQSVTGIVKSSGTTRSAATAGTDYQAPVSATGILKSSGVSGNVSAAVAGTDYVAPAGTFFIGTTSIAHNRASASLSMTGVNIDGAAGTASVATTVTATASTTASAFKIAMLNTTGVATGNFGLLLDSAAAGDFTYNPSTNIMTVGGVDHNTSTSTFSVNNVVTAAGTTQGTAFTIATDLVNIATGTVNQGVIFPFRVAGHRIIVRNSTAVTIKVYPNSGAQINTLGSNIGFDIPTLSVLEFVCFSSTQWYTLNSTFA